MKFNTLTLANAIALLRTKKISHKELYRDIFAVIDNKNKELHIYLSLDREASKKAEKNTSLPLAGIPIAVKDNFSTRFLPTTASAKMLEDFHPPYESTVTKRLVEKGGVIIGKTNLDAWAHGSSTETSDFGPTKNPRNTAHVPGGSSGGSAAAVAADMCITSIGSETAGSIRVPAAWCGAVGLKPTYGRVPRTGVVAMGSSLDSPGPLAKTVEDAAILLSVIAGRDPYDATTGDAVVRDYKKCLQKGIRGFKVGICYMDHPDLKGTQISRSVGEAGKLFKSLGATVDIVPMSHNLRPHAIMTPDHAIGVYTVVQRSEVSSNLARYDGIRYGRERSSFGVEAKRRIMLGTFTLSRGYADKYYIRAEQVRNMYIKNFHELFSHYDILISSPTPGYALKFGESEGNPMFGELTDVLNEPSALAGITAVSVPCYWDEKTGLPLGLSIMADHWQEEKVLRAAYAFEQNTNWNPWAKQKI
jgi:aspartyl-tRNA(Asn)/glutamyl-tRNA(Gln) amidotransferase subunit A